MAAPVLAFPSPVFVADEGSIDFTPTVTNGESVTSWSASGLPTGASINTSTGQITGTLSTTAITRGSITATNGDGSFTVPFVVHVYGSTGTISSADSFPYYCNTAHRKYTLTSNITVDGSAIALTAANVSLDLDGFTITYNDATPISIANHSFETVDAVDSTHAENWDWTNAPTAERFNGVFIQNTVYDGDYSLRFPAATVSEYIESEATITLEANTTYVISGMFKYTSGGNPGVVAYIHLIGTGAEPTRELNYTGNFHRGFQFAESAAFTTGGSAEEYTVRVGITGHASATLPFYIDNIKVQRTLNYGVMVGPQAWAPTRYPDLTSYGTSTPAIVTGGSIVQGQDGGTWSHAVRYDSNNQILVLDSLTLEVNGANTSSIWTTTGVKTATITSNMITSDVLTITSRDNNHGAVMFWVQGEIANNTILNGPHTGIYTGNSVNSDIHHNTISLTSRYTNSYAIGAGGAAQIHHNTINGHTGNYTCRGIANRGGTEATPARIYDNIVNVQELGNNQEYGGSQTGGSYGIQVEESKHLWVYNNTVTAYGTSGEAHALRLGPYGNVIPENVKIYDNTFTAVDGSAIASPLKIFGSAALLNLDGVEFYDNTLETSNAILGGSVNAGISLLRTHITVTSPVADPAVFGADWKVGTFTDIHSVVKFVDTTFEDAGSRTHFINGEISGANDGVSFEDRMQVELAWTTTLIVKDSGDTLLPDVAVTILDDTAAEIFSGTTDGDGEYAAEVPEVTIIGDDQTTHGTYSANVSGDSESFTADQAQTINLVATVAELPPEYVSGGSLSGDYDLLSGNIGSFNGYGYPTTYEWEIRDSEAGVHKSGTGSTFSEAGPHPIDTYSLYARATNAYGDSGWVLITSFEQEDDGVDPAVNYHDIVAQAATFDHLNGSTIGTPQTGSGAYRSGGPWGHQLYDRDVGNYVNYGTVAVPTTGSLVMFVKQDATAAGTMTAATVQNTMSIHSAASSLNLRGFGYDGGFRTNTAYTTDTNLHHAAVIADGSTVKLYVDGTERDSKACGNLVATGTDVLRIGAAHSGGSYDGAFGEFGWFPSLILTTDQIAELIAGPEPQNLVVPSAPTGTPTEGETLTASDMGTWDNFGRTDGDPTYSIRWQRDNGGGEIFENIDDATGTTYTLTADDVGCHVRYVVRAANLGGYRVADDTPSASTELIASSGPPGDTDPPELQSATVGPNRTRWRLKFTEPTFGTGGFSGVGSTTGSITLTYVSGSGTSTHIYEGDVEVVPGEDVTLDYDDEVGDLADAAENTLADIDDFVVTNNTRDQAGLARANNPRANLERSGLLRSTIARTSL